MHRTQLMLDDDLYQELRLRAFQSGKSLAQVTRELLRQALMASDAEADPKRWTRAFQVMGRFHEPDEARDVSERHDDYLWNS